MTRWLLKTEPSAYSFDDLAREGRTAWTGVANPQAQANLRSMRRGERAVVYHTGSQKAAVGLAEVAREAYPEPGEAARVCVDLAAGERLPTPVPLSALKRARAFAGSALVRQGRLSVVPLDEAQWAALVSLAGAGPKAVAGRGARPGKRRPPDRRSRPKAKGRAGR
jgi:predicted RNA-binding protein with PUA-like domain